MSRRRVVRGWDGLPFAIPVLYPQRVRAAGIRTLLLGVWRHVRGRGYYPTQADLAAMMALHQPTILWYAKQAQAEGLLDRVLNGDRGKILRPTAAGWAWVGVMPVEPWCLRPGKRLVTALAREIAVRLHQDDPLTQAEVKRWRAAQRRGGAAMYDEQESTPSLAQDDAP